MFGVFASKSTCIEPEDKANSWFFLKFPACHLFIFILMMRNLRKERLKMSTTDLCDTIGMEVL